MRINKNYYNFSFGAYCGALVDEDTMKKIAKLQYETYDKLKTILENSKVLNIDWSISEIEEVDLPQNIRTFNYAETNKDFDRIHLLKDLFNIKKVKDLYFVEAKNGVIAMEIAEKEHKDHLLNIYK